MIIGIKENEMKNEIIEFIKENNIENICNDNEILNKYIGKLIIGKLSYWKEWAYDFINNKEPKEPFVRKDSEIAIKDKTYRKYFSNLDEEIKKQLKNLINEIMEGIIFSVLSTFDGIDGMEIKIKYEDIQGIINKETELHEDLYEWIKLFFHSEFFNSKNVYASNPYLYSGCPAMASSFGSPNLYCINRLNVIQATPLSILAFLTFT
jgi:hypothetical protein